MIWPCPYHAKAQSVVLFVVQTEYVFFEICKFVTNFWEIFNNVLVNVWYRIPSLFVRGMF